MSLASSREGLLRLVADLDDTAFRTQFHPEYSPIGWHVGHVVFQEEMFLLRRLAGRAPRLPDLDGVFDSFRSEKARRGQQLPDRAFLLEHAAGVRHDVERLLRERAGDPEAEALARFLANHERQHTEIVVTVRLLGGLYQSAPLVSAPRGSSPAPCASARDNEWQTLPGGTFPLGCTDDPDGWDNERPAHRVDVRGFLLQRFPVSEREWLEMMRAGGYSDRRLWSMEGWSFRVAQGLAAPFHWQADPDGGYSKRTLQGVAAVGGDCPVAHVSYYEAEAFARFVGARLPSEAEWEYAASWDPAARHKRRFPWGDELREHAADFGLVGPGPLPRGSHARGCSALGVEDLCGGVWEWVESAFQPYPGFSAGAYAAYSAPWFGTAYRVARGGSFATAPENARAAFRNWYAPHQREPCLGVRLARDLG